MVKRQHILLYAIFLMLALLFAAGCSIGHKTMRGSVLMKLDNTAHICIGSDDDIRPGDILFVYRIKVEDKWWLAEYLQRYPGETPKNISYQKIKVGEVRVTEIFNEHFAAVTLISGELQGNDIVEKRWLR
jgi:hypothetical protein